MILDSVMGLLDSALTLIDKKIKLHEHDEDKKNLVELGRAKSRIMGAKAGIAQTNEYFKQKGITE